MKFLFIKKSIDPVLITEYRTLKFICVNKPLNIDFTSVFPLDIEVQWTQISGPTITIENSNTINPTVIFPINYNSEDVIVLKLEAVGYSETFVTIEIDTNILSKTNPSSLLIKNNSFIPQESIPKTLIPVYSGEKLDYGVYFNPSLNTTFIASYQEVEFPLDIIKIEWYENINGEYTLVSSNKTFNHNINRHVKAKYFFKLNDFRTEEVVTDVLTDLSFFTPTVIAASTLSNNLDVRKTSSIITRLNYLEFIFNTLKEVEDTDNFSILSNLNVKDEESLITRNNYLEYIIVTDKLVELEELKISSQLSFNFNIESLVSRLSYQFNGAGLTIG